jgi:hypothetical protein
MSEQQFNENHLAFQSRLREVLSGDKLQAALEFTTFLSENEMALSKSFSPVSYKENAVCYMHLDDSNEFPGPWTIWPGGDFNCEDEAVPMNDSMKQITWDNVNVCTNCDSDCNAGKSRVVLGKEFENLCAAVVVFNQPSGETLQCLTKLILMRKNAIDRQLGN